MAEKINDKGFLFNQAYPQVGMRSFINASDFCDIMPANLFQYIGYVQMIANAA